MVIQNIIQQTINKLDPRRKKLLNSVANEILGFELYQECLSLLRNYYNANYSNPPWPDDEFDPNELATALNFLSHDKSMEDFYQIQSFWSTFISSLPVQTESQILEQANYFQGFSFLSKTLPGLFQTSVDKYFNPETKERLNYAQDQIQNKFTEIKQNIPTSTVEWQYEGEKLIEKAKKKWFSKNDKQDN